ncbi:MAG: hypothetical protein GY844_05250 [Bradyrhizobium sp.]|nr:hypothetical protein [Bradyrhizobium sp.]
MVKRIDGSGVHLGAECNETGRLGRGQLENSNKLRCRLEQARAMAGLVVQRGSRRPDIAEFPEQTMNIVNHAGLGRITEQ